MASFFRIQLEQCWYGNNGWCILLQPLAWLFQMLSAGRRYYWQYCRRHAKPKPVPLLVVGNIAVGGTGKTPLIIAIALHLQQLGLKPGVISRGYGSRATHYPYCVNNNSPVQESGDEALLIVKSTQCPLVISPNRRQALAALLRDSDCDVVLSDDGLQHYALARNLEVAVIDGSRGLGNGRCLPAGPLRESPRRLRTVNYVVVNGPLQHSRGIPDDFIPMSLKAGLWRRVIDDSEGQLAEISVLETVHALTGIGNPERFYLTLRESNVQMTRHSFADHHNFTLADIVFPDDLPVVMTAKDAVKCQALLRASELSETKRRRFWYVPVQAQLPSDFYQQLVVDLQRQAKSTTATAISTE